jgi:glycine betaine/proline transport system permease protein
VGGIAIVLLAMMLDRITQKLAQPKDAKSGSLLTSVFRLVCGQRVIGPAPAVSEKPQL